MLTGWALVLAVALPTRLAIEPWTGANLPTATTAAIRYRLHVSGAPKTTLTLRADRLAKGWLAAFCTPKVCAPIRVDVTLPKSGQAIYQFELIREDSAAAARSGARISSSDGASITLSR